jgi:hypothetical protein
MIHDSLSNSILHRNVIRIEEVAIIISINVAGAWQYARQDTPSMSPSKWIFFNGSIPAVVTSYYVQSHPNIVSGLPEKKKLVINDDVADYSEENRALSSQTTGTDLIYNHLLLLLSCFVGLISKFIPL